MNCPKCNSADVIVVAGTWRCNQCEHYFTPPPAPPGAPHPPQNAAFNHHIMPCPSCLKSVSLTAESCPHCGHFFHTAGRVKITNPVHLVGLLICAAIVLLVTAYVLYMSTH